MKGFKHKKTQEALWLQDQQNLPWVAAEIAVLAPETVQLNIFAWNQKLTKYVKDGQSEKVMQFFNKCDEKELVLTNSLLFRHVLVKEHS
jgi:hypothetical protein